MLNDSIVERLPGGCLVLKRDGARKRVAKGSRHVAAQAMAEQQWAEHERDGDGRDAGQRDEQPRRWLIQPGAEVVLKPARRQRPLRCGRQTRPARGVDLGDPQHVASKRCRKQ